MRHWEEVDEAADNVTPATDSRGDWDHTKVLNRNLDKAGKILREYSKALKEEADAKDDAGQTK